jgi:hypothetical protein
LRPCSTSDLTWQAVKSASRSSCSCRACTAFRVWRYEAFERRGRAVSQQPFDVVERPQQAIHLSLRRRNRDFARHRRLRPLRRALRRQRQARARRDRGAGRPGGPCPQRQPLQRAGRHRWTLGRAAGRSGFGVRRPRRRRSGGPRGGRVGNIDHGVLDRVLGPMVRRPGSCAPGAMRSELRAGEWATATRPGERRRWQARGHTSRRHPGERRGPLVECFGVCSVRVAGRVPPRRAGNFGVRITLLRKVSGPPLREHLLAQMKSIAVGMPVTGHPPHRSVRAQFGHTAPTLGV